MHQITSSILEIGIPAAMETTSFSLDNELDTSFNTGLTTLGFTANTIMSLLVTTSLLQFVVLIPRSWKTKCYIHVLEKHIFL